LLNDALLSPKFRLIGSAVSAALLAAFLAGDGMARSDGGPSFLAPSAASLWLAVALGAVVGTTGAVWERFLLVRRRAEQLARHRIPIEERLWWRHQRADILQSGWFLLLVYSLIGWCAWAGVFALPPLLAANVVQFACNLRLVEAFRAELKCQPGPELCAAPDRGT